MSESGSIGSYDDNLAPKKPKKNGNSSPDLSCITPPAMEPRLKSLAGQHQPFESPKTQGKGLLTAKKLFNPKKLKKPVLPEWTDGEREKLTEFLLLYTEGKSWVLHKDMHFWESCGKFIQQFTLTSHCRSGKCICIAPRSDSVLNLGL